MKTQPRLLPIFCFAALSFFSLGTPCLADKRVALVIGNGAYKNTAGLSNPPNDAADVAEALKAIGFDVTLKVDVEKRQMDQAIAQFAREGRGADAVLFYYAGHGMQYGGRNYLMPVDAELQDEVSLRYEMVGFDDVKATMQLSPGIKIMVLDACRDNPLAERFVRSISLSTRDVPMSRGFAPPEKAQGMIVVFATQVDDVAQDGTGRNSPFSAAFLKEIREPGLEVGSMFRRIGADVYAATNGRQSPELSVSMVPEYYLNQSETDQTIWARIRTRADYSTLKEFLSRYPDSFYAPDARALMDLLEREAREKADREAAAHEIEQRESEAARLQEEQAKSEHAADQAGAHERELAAKLAAAEDERRKLEQELTERAADQATAEARSKSELEKLQKAQEQREADLRAQIDKEQATASQLEKERLLREALERERKRQADEDQARAERERAANEEKARELQSEADRAEALKTQIATLERQANDAKAAADAEVQKAEDAKKAAAEAAKSASIVPTAAAAPPASEPAAERRPLVSPIEAELHRIGCYDGGEKDWDAPEVRLGLAEYARYAKLSATPSAPDGVLLDSLKNLRERVCPLQCAAGEVVVNGRCVAAGCPRGEVLGRDGACYPLPAPRVTAAREAERPAVTRSTVLREERAAAPRKPKPAPREAVRASGGHCFSFNGSQYCE
ncbi:MAG: caspase family protein [Roseiarcus sp.]|uniref:caspase family protein n=1 Tax=Roseiarcus sp. TaxID=1969460 RepID=UPI003C671541